jgi:hypothetical protein
MKSHLVELLTRKTLVAAQLMLVTLAVLAVWIFNAMGGGDALLSARETLFVRVSRLEFLMIVLLLMLNVSASYAIFRQFQSLNRSVKWSTGLMILSLLALTAWIARLFLFQGVTVSMPEEVTAGVGRVELLMGLLLVFATMMGGLLLYRRYKHVEPFVVLSAYSKKVQYKGEWVTIEEYLVRELGIHVSHGITPEEKEEALAQFQRDMAAGETGDEAAETPVEAPAQPNPTRR